MGKMADEQHFRTWLLDDYHHRVHSETNCAPQARWEAGGFLPRMLEILQAGEVELVVASRYAAGANLGDFDGRHADDLPSAAAARVTHAAADVVFG